MRIGRLAAVAAAMTMALGVAACGDDDEDEAGTPAATSAAAPTKPQTLAIEIGGSAKKATITVPPSIPAGLTAITVTQTAKGEHAVQLIRYDDGYSVEQVLKTGDGWGDEGKRLPPWIHLEGGAAGNPERPNVSTQVLPAGKYLAIDFGDDESGKEEVTAEFEVTEGDAGGEVPAPASNAKVEMREYAFAASGLKAGRQQVLVDNVGKEPHFIVGAPLAAGKTIEDAKKYFASEEEASGPPPVDFEQGGFDTGVIDGGKQQVVDLDLEQGSYAFICFVPDRAGGPPHVAKGMISEVKAG